MNLANVFDGLDEAGRPILSASRTSVSDPDERPRIERFLKGGGIVLGTGRKSIDNVDPNRGRVVPIFYRTDGIWIWPVSIAYYMYEHDIPIETDFLEHVRRSDYTAVEPTMDRVKEALQLLYGPE
ncbi:hypothetical protein ACFXHA_06890 [Nocardia sp. NPDC059240]|uniref:hypothetical protein n=1 Tax=Nocardia sp. NPDC059240 TaxID=3346786 RepID=UPI0036A02375